MLFSAHYSYGFYRKDGLLYQLTRTQGLTVNSFSKKAETLLSYHKEFSIEDTLLNLYPIVRLYVSEPRADGGVQGHQLVTLFERYEPDRPRTLLQLGGAYFALWVDYGENGDYEKALKYFNRVQELRPNDPYSLYCLYSLHVNHGDAEAETVKVTIERNWNNTPKSETCALPSGF